MMKQFGNYFKYNAELEPDYEPGDDPRWTNNWRILFHEPQIWSFIPTPLKLRNQNFNALSRFVMALTLFETVKERSAQPLVIGAMALVGVSYLFPSLNKTVAHGDELAQTDPAYTKTQEQLALERKQKVERKLADAKRRQNERLVQDFANDRSEASVEFGRVTGTIDELADSNHPQMIGDTAYVRQLRNGASVGAEAMVSRDRGNRHAGTVQRLP